MVQPGSQANPKRIAVVDRGMDKGLQTRNITPSSPVRHRWIVDGRNAMVSYFNVCDLFHIQLWNYEGL